MNKFLRYIFTAIVLVFVLNTFAAVETRAQVYLILNQMDARYKKLKTLRTTIIFEKYDSILNDSDILKGRAILLPMRGKNLYFRIDWRKPDESIAIVNGQYVVYRPKLRQAYTGSTEKRSKNYSGTNGALSFLNMSKAELKANFSIKYIGAEKLSSGRKTWHLELMPKKSQPYKKADIWINGMGMPLQIKVTEKNNDTSTVLLVDARTNVEVKGSEFQIKLPKGTRIIKG